MKKDLCIFDHLRFFLMATAAPFFLLFFPTRFLGIYSFAFVGVLGLMITLVILAFSYYEWGRDTLPRNRLDRRMLLFGVLPCGAIYLLFLAGIWTLLFIVKMHWHFSTVYLAATAFPPLGGFLKLWGVGRGFFSDERVIAWYMTLLFLLFCLFICTICLAVPIVSYEIGVRTDEKEEAMAARGEKIVRKSFTKKMFFVPFLNLVSFFPWMLRHMIHPEAKFRELFLPFLVIGISGFGYHLLSLFLTDLVQSMVLYYALRLLGIYLLGLFFSFVELIDEKKYAFLT